MWIRVCGFLLHVYPRCCNVYAYVYPFCFTRILALLLPSFRDSISLNRDFDIVKSD